MKVIAKKGHKKYICEINHEEIEKFLNRYYSKNDLDELAVDQEIDLGKGHNFYQDTVRALKQTEDFIKAHRPIVKAITDGFLLVGNGPENLDLTLGEE